MDKNKENKIPLLGTLVNNDESGIIAHANQILHESTNKSVDTVLTETSSKTQETWQKQETLQNTWNATGLEGGTVQAAAAVTISTEAGLIAANVEDAVKELASNINEIPVVKEQLDALGGDIEILVDDSNSNYTKTNTNSISIEEKVNALISCVILLIEGVVFHTGTPFVSPPELASRLNLLRLTATSSGSGGGGSVTPSPDKSTTAICGQAICGQAVCGKSSTASTTSVCGQAICGQAICGNF